MHKLSHLVDGEWVEHRYERVYQRERTSAPGWRLKAGVPGGDPDIFERLTMEMQPPFFLLYVLHTPRGEAKAGRYQSDELDAFELRSLLARFGPFPSADARFDLWAHSDADDATVVWDRHNLIYVYGPLDRFAAALEGMGFRQGTVTLPLPHAHHYREECDAVAGEPVREPMWHRSPPGPRMSSRALRLAGGDDLCLGDVFEQRYELTSDTPTRQPYSLPHDEGIHTLLARDIPTIP